MKNRMPEDNIDFEKDKLLDHAWAHSKLGMYEDAIVDCENLIKLDNNDPLAYRELAISYEEHNQIDKAIECYRFAIKRFPNYHAAYTNLGHLFQEYKKRLDIALVCYEKAVELNPQDFWAVHNIGTVLKKEYKIEEAFNYFLKAYEITQTQGIIKHKIIHNLAWATYRCKKYDIALALYNNLISMIEISYKYHGSIHFEAGCVNYRVGRYQDAIVQFEQALSYQPDNRFYKRGLQIAFTRMNK
jgi:tetratricopeptide (TPR) repeat protein